MNAQLYCGLEVAKSNMTHELDKTNPFINMSWVKAKRVLDCIRVNTINFFYKRVMFVFNIWTQLTHLTYLAYKVITYFDIIA